jgi:2-keto-4-pentenoate hydratase/2-oxohepta-3-ene-1,7-dioic acid hydratase in catechol pathway
MRLTSFTHGGRAGFGAVLGEEIADLAGLLPGAPGRLRDALALDPALLRAALPGAPRLKLAQVALRPPIPDPDKIVCVGINYRSHAGETGRAVTETPSLFIRLARTLVAPGGTILRPRVSTHLDFEGELAVVVGRGGRHIPRAEALAHVAGYACFNDASVRDWQKQSVTAGKNFEATAPFGPWIVTADEIPDPAALTLETRLNGQVVQHAPVSALIHDVPALIAYVSGFTRLEPGDVIATGTPEGVGSRRVPPLWMQAGDVVEVEISGIGTLRNTVAEEG